MDQTRVKTGLAFDFEGFWWVPSADGPPSHPAQGHLRYEPSEGIELSIVDLFGGIGQSLNHPSQLPVLHGMAVDGTPCTMFGAICRHASGNILGGHSQERWGSNLFVHGAHLSALDDLSVSQIRVGLRGLSRWLTAPWAGRQTAFDDIAENGVVESSLWAGTKLVFQRETEESTKPLSTTRMISHSALFEFEQPTTFADLNERCIRPLHDLLILGTKEEIRVTETTVLVAEELEKWWDADNPIKHVKEVSIVCREQLLWHAERPNAFHEVPLPLAGLGVDPTSVIPQWYKLRADVAGPGNALFSALNRRYKTLEVELLSLLSAAEGYHRAMFNTLVVSEKEHADAVKAMIDALPTGLKENYERRLRHANEQTQSQRIRELFKRAESIVPATHKWRKSVHGLIQTRNYLTHWGEESKFMLSIDEQIQALTKLEIVLRINLMHDMGVAASDIERSIALGFGQHAVFAS